MAFLDYFVNNNNQEQYVADPPAYTNETEDVKCGSKPSSCDKPKPCNPCPPKPCEPCKPPRPHCEPQPQPPKPCCSPCPPRPVKPCPKPCPKPLPCRKPCDPCAPTQGDNEVGWDRDSDSENPRPCPPEPVCIYNACNLVIWVSINLLFSAFSLVYALNPPVTVPPTPVNVLNVIFIALNIGINFLGLAGLYNNCHDYIQFAAWWQWISVPLSILFAYQTLIGGGLANLIAFLQDSGFTVASAIGDFLANLAATAPAILNLIIATVFVFYVAAVIYFAFQWAEAACARCVIVDCENDCGWFKTIVDLIGSLLPAPVSVISQVFLVLGSLCSSQIIEEKSASVGYGSYQAAAEKAV